MARRTAEQWSKLVARWKRSGKTAEEFGAEAGVDARSLHWWRWALRKREAKQDARVKPGEPLPAFLSVRLVERPAALAKTPAPLPGGPVEILVDDRHAVRVRAGFDEATLRRVLDILRTEEVG